MSTGMILLIIFAMFAVSFPVRFIPLVYFNRITVPRVVRTWLSFVPVAIFAALLTQIVFGEYKESTTLIDNLPLWIGILGAILVTVKTRSIGWGMGLGFGVYLASCFLMNRV